VNENMHLLIDDKDHLRITLFRSDGTRQTVALTAHEGNINVYSEAPHDQPTPELVLVTERIARVRGAYKPE
jgi:hypothetical protein